MVSKINIFSKIFSFIIIFSFLLLRLEASPFDHPKDIPNPKSSNSEWQSILDEAKLLSIEEKTTIQSNLDSLEKEKGVQIAIVLLNSIGENDPKTFAHDLFQHWGIGRKGVDDGLLFLMVLDKRKWTFETGYGLEGTLPDVVLKRIGDGILVPLLKEGKPGEAISSTFQAIATIVREDGSLDKANILILSDWETSQENQEEEFWDEETILSIFIVTGFIYAFVCLSIIGTAMETFSKISKKEMNVDNRLEELKKYWKAPWVKYGFLFLLPTMIILGMIYFSYRRKLAQNKKNCPSCGNHTYEILPNKRSQKYMDKIEAIEHRLGSGTTIVWECSGCKHMEKISSRSPYANNYHCSSCNHYTVKSRFSHTIVEPTYSSGGSDRYIDECLYCGDKNERTVSTPKLVKEEETSYSTGSGGVSYSSTSSSSSSGSGWGGGRSGGGGASGSW